MQGLMQGPSPAAPPDPQAPPEPEFEINLGEYVAMIRRHWKLALAIALASIAISFGHFLVTPKSYMAQATLLIERRSLSPQLTTQNPWIDTYNLEFYPTQYKLLESRGLAERVVRNLDLMADPSLHLPPPGAPAGAGIAPSLRNASTKGRDVAPTPSAAED
ncbi:MAG TPA: Wzz/FepE/Etk N-terminal domain-containing protein, partial [Thermoanaerobaculia bacterium]